MCQQKGESKNKTQGVISHSLVHFQAVCFAQPCDQLCRAANTAAKSPPTLALEITKLTDLYQI